MAAGRRAVPAAVTYGGLVSVEGVVEPGARPKVRRLKADARRQQMIDAAREVFLERGLDGSRTKDIAQAAGVSEAIIYRHFASKEEFFEAAILEPLGDHLGSFAKLTADFAALRGRERYERSVTVHRDALLSMQRIVPLLGVALFSDRTHGRTFYRTRVAPLIDEGAEVLARSMSGWEHAPVDAVFLFRSIFGTYFALALDAAMREEALNVDKLARQLTDLFNAALRGSTERTD